MSEHAPRSPEQEIEPTQELVQYNDGAMAIVYRTPGEVISRDYREIHKYLSDLGRHTQVIISTESGNSYGLGSGIVINSNTGKSFRAPHPTEIPDITIGRSLEIPGVGTTTAVKSVAYEYKSADLGYNGAEQIDIPSPFEPLRNAIQSIQDRMAR